MAAGVNKVTLIGNLGRDPEVRYTQGGSAVSNLRIAVTERRKDRDSDGWKDHTEWVNVVCFGKTAENVGQYLQKGRQIYVDGRLQTRSYKDKDGNEKWVTEVVANQILFLGGRDGADAPSGRPMNGAPRGGGRGEGRSAPPADAGHDDAPPPDQGFYDDDLPF